MSCTFRKCFPETVNTMKAFTTSERATPTYQLFGEHRPWLAPEPVHHETIAARSALYQWDIRPHSHDDLVHLLLVEAGEASMTLELLHASLTPPCVVFMPARHVHGFHFSRDVLGHVVTLPTHVLRDLLAISPELKTAFDVPRYVPLETDSRAYKDVSTWFERIAAEFSGSAPGRLGSLMATVGLIFIWLARTAKPGEVHHAGRARLRVGRFLELVDAHFREAHPVSWYAGRVGVSTAQLAQDCNKEAGRSPKALLHDRLLLEARRMLAYSDLDVTAICYSLGFRDPAYFARFFARHHGMPPSAFRRLHVASV